MSMDPNAVLQQMQAAMHQLQGETAQLQAQLQQQQQQQHAPRASLPRLNPPAHYDGTATTLDHWVAEVQRQIDYNVITAEADRIRVAVIELNGGGGACV